MTRPKLLIVVDTEEEFDWSRPFSREATSTRTIPAQARAHEIYDRFGIVPTYVVDYPVATDPRAAAFLRALKGAGRAEIGTHVHPWVTPPHAEKVNPRNSYHCNLPPDLERAKIVAATEAVEQAFGERPIVFKAGRYGFGPTTARVIAELGYRIDCSKLPYTDLRPDGGPDFRGTPPDPHWLAEGPLEVPLTIGFFGAAAGIGPKVERLFDSPGAARLRLPGLLARSGVVTRSRLTPEGVPAEEQCRLIEALVRRGQRVFTLAYHSPSLEPGHTPYVRSDEDLAQFLAAIHTVLTFFRDRIGGRFTTLTQLYRDLSDARAAA
ncbi:MAG TPA: polysaccharide deacetylase family protein [Allosphingosinicella sp.]